MRPKTTAGKPKKSAPGPGVVCAEDWCLVEGSIDPGQLFLQRNNVIKVKVMLHSNRTWDNMKAAVCAVEIDPDLGLGDTY